MSNVTVTTSSAIPAAVFALLSALSPADAKPLYFTGNEAPTIWVGDTGGAGVAPASVLYSGVAGGVVGIDESQGELFWATARSTSVVVGAADGAGTPSALANSSVAGADVQLDVAVDRAGGRYFFTVAAGATGTPGLYQANLDGAGESTLIDVGVGPTAVIYDAASDYLYYANNTNVIRRIRPDGTGQEDVFTSTVDTYCDIAADFAAGRLYYTESLEAVGVLDLGTLSTTTLFDPAGTVRSVDFDPATQTLYWAAFGVNPNGDDAVQSGTADGTGPITTLYEGDFQNLRGLAVAQVPEPSSGMLLMLAAGVCWLTIQWRREL